ncbi:MAG: anhydro-N-acetylmuramic acid kinase [Bacteroidales bacterium]|nr:anhydro-N-acetylmuramic acid kinase [Bacteroidales bacterium]
MSEHLAIGLMSGSSLDGVDLALVKFQSENGKYGFNILQSTTLPYSAEWENLLSEAFHQKPEDLTDLDKAYGEYLGRQVLRFMQDNDIIPNFVASHGHTIFHKPEEHYTLQIGDGQALANACGLKVINDFRSEDVSKGGQGAPLVPIGDKLLFSEYEACLNIGGIANVSYDQNGQRIAYDICIANQALNYLANQKGLKYDKDGLLARNGAIDEALLAALNSNAFFKQKAPKSLGREFFEAEQKHLFKGKDISDLLATFTEHIAMQIEESLKALPKGKLLITGGGALNKYLVERIQHHTIHQVVIPEKQIIEYKEALVFAFLGLLKLEGKTNVLCSVTGAESDSCSGKIWNAQ